MPNQENIPFFNLQEKSLFLIRPLLEAVNPQLLNEAAHRHTYQEILWIQEGNGQHSIDDELFTIENNTFYLIYKGQVHHFIEGKGLKGFLIRFNNEFLNEISPLERNTNFLVNKIAVNEVERANFDNLTGNIYQEFLSKKQHNESIIRHLLMVLLYKLEEKKQTYQLQQIAKNADSEDAIFIRFTNLLEQVYSNSNDTEYFANHLAISTRHLCRIIKKHSGKTTKQLIIDRRILEAKRLLAYTDTPLKQIAFQLGFDEIAYFCRIFKQQTALTPTEFKQKTHFTA
jgi:AraC family transcriptional regulator, transcriptional activator of pobA